MLCHNYTIDELPWVGYNGRVAYTLQLLVSNIHNLQTCEGEKPTQTNTG